MRLFRCCLTRGYAYKDYLKVRTRTALGPYGRSIPRSIGPSKGWCVSLISSSPCKGSTSFGASEVRHWHWLVGNKVSVSQTRGYHLTSAQTSHAPHSHSNHDHWWLERCGQVPTYHTTPPPAFPPFAN